jgi:segregation and condensation protein B
MPEPKLDDKKLKSIIESILFVAERPVSVKKLAEISSAFVSQIQEALVFLIQAYKDKGINIVRKGNYVHFSTASKNTKYIAKYLNENIQKKLSKEALETLAIIFYRQPITRTEIEKIRNVDSESVLQNLQIRGLVAAVERKKIQGEPIVYGTTMEFVQYFGVENLKNLMEIGKKETIRVSQPEAELKLGLDTIKKKKKK